MATCVLVRDFREPIGGYESWVDSLSVGLLHHGLEVILLVPRSEGSEAMAQKLAPTRIVYVGESKDSVQQATFLLDGLRELSREGLSGVFFTLCYPYVNIAGINLFGSPWAPIPVMHGSYENVFDWMFMGPPRAVVAPSEKLFAMCDKDLRKRVGLLRSLGVVQRIPHGVPLVAGGARVRALRDSGQRLQIAVASRLEPVAKRPLDYIEIARALRQRGVLFEMKIAGGGSLFEQMNNLISVYGLKSEVRMLGVLSRSGVHDMMVAADVFLATSESEAFGLSIAEALAASCAVVCADIDGEIPKLVNSQTGFRVPVGDYEGYADRLSQLAKFPRLAREMGLAGQKLIEQHYSEEVMLRRYAAMVRRIARTTAPNPSWEPASEVKSTPANDVVPGLLARIGVPLQLRTTLRQIWRLSRL